MTKILVTGAAGFIGSTIVARLISDQSADVVGIDSLTDYYDPELKLENVRDNAASNFTFINNDINGVDVNELLDGVEEIYHQAGQPGVRNSWGSEFAYYVESNISATQRLLEAAKESSALRRFVYASSSSVYGDAASFPTRESDRPMPRSPYGVTKLSGEQLSSLYAANFGVPTVSLRYFTVYGPRQRPDMAFNRFIRAALEGREIQVFGTGEQIREFTYVQDIVEANLLAARSPVEPGTVINLSGGSAVSLNEALATIESIHGAPLRISRTEAVAGDVLRTGGSTKRAREILGWEPKVNLRQGLRAEYDWLRAAPA